jgi:hypothetical protein
MKFKVGDKVRILDKTIGDNLEYWSQYAFLNKKDIYIISGVFDDSILLHTHGYDLFFRYSDLELVEEKKEDNMEYIQTKAISLKAIYDTFVNNNKWTCPEAIKYYDELLNNVGSLGFTYSLLYTKNSTLYKLIHKNSKILNWFVSNGFIQQKEETFSVGDVVEIEGIKHIIAALGDNTVILITSDGLRYYYTFTVQQLQSITKKELNNHQITKCKGKFVYKENN